MNLQRKAPNFWAKLNMLSSTFEHVQASGAEALEELRTAYSRRGLESFTRWVQPHGCRGLEAPLEWLPPFDTLGGEDLYNLRRDAEGRALTLGQRDEGATCKFCSNGVCFT